MSEQTTFITLGSGGGPMLAPDRSQPSHVVLHGERPIIFDCGEGSVGQLKKAGIEYRSVRDLFLSHHHFDHIGSLFAWLGLSMMTQRQEKLNIYGPVGTAQILEGLFSACDRPHSTGFGVPGQVIPHPREFVAIRELVPGEQVIIDDVKVSCCENTHYRPEAEFGQDGDVSLSYRVDAPDRSILFTGDTGPCGIVEDLAKGVDLLVGEMMDVEVTVARIRQHNPNLPEARLNMIKSHLSDHHLSPEQLGEMAARAGAGQVVAVHLAPGFITPDSKPKYIKRIASVFSGEVAISSDLDRY